MRVTSGGSARQHKTEVVTTTSTLNGALLHNEADLQP